MWQDLVVTLVIGLCAGTAAAFLLRGRGFGLIVNLVVGVLGGFIGHLALPLLGLGASGVVGRFSQATIGAACLLILVAWLPAKRRGTRAT